MNGQIEREYREALDGLRFSRKGKERIMNGLMNEREQRVDKSAGRRGLSLVRSGLMAACLCLALVGTAFAAAAVYRLTVQISEEEDWGQEYVRYDVYGEPVLHPLEDFPQQFRDDFEAWDHPSILFNKHFDTWEETRAYLGDNIPAVWHSMDGIAFTDDYRVWPMYEMYGDRKITYVQVYNVSKQSSGLSYSTEIFIYTPDYAGEALTGVGWWRDSGDFQVLDSYAMANGCVAEVVMGTREFGDGDLPGQYRDFIGTFMREGLLYRVDLMAPLNCTLSQAELEAQLHQILDSFQ